MHLSLLWPKACVSLVTFTCLVACSNATPLTAERTPSKSSTFANEDDAVPDPSVTLGTLSEMGLKLPPEPGSENATKQTTAASIDGGPNALEWSALGSPLARWFCPIPSANIRLDLAPGDHSARNSYWMSWLAMQGYIGKGAFPLLWRTGFAWTHEIFDRSTSLLGFVASTPDFTVVSFAGSGSLKDWIYDLSFAQREDNRHGLPGRFHSGFYDSMEGKWNSLSREVKWQSQGNKPVFVVGHSLGGALAVLAAARLSREGHNVAGVYAFAAPRVGNRTFAKDYEARLGSRTWRFENNEDLIPHLAPAALGAREFSRLVPDIMRAFLYESFSKDDYTHVGKIMQFDADGGLSGPYPENLSIERAFWTNIYKRSDGKNLLQKILLNWRIAGDHIPSVNFCYQKPPA